MWFSCWTKHDLIINFFSAIKPMEKSSFLFSLEGTSVMLKLTLRLFFYFPHVCFSLSPLSFFRRSWWSPAVMMSLACKMRTRLVQWLTWRIWATSWAVPRDQRSDSVRRNWFIIFYIIHTSPCSWCWGNSTERNKTFRSLYGLIYFTWLLAPQYHS